MSELLGYVRVSTASQDEALQVDALSAAGVERLWFDHASGAVAERPELGKLLDYARPGDTLVVWRLDRLGRSLRHLVDVIQDVDQRKIGFRSLNESIDTTTSTGNSSSTALPHLPSSRVTNPRTHRRELGCGPGPWARRRPFHEDDFGEDRGRSLDVCQRRTYNR